MLTFYPQYLDMVIFQQYSDRTFKVAGKWDDGTMS